MKIIIELFNSPLFAALGTFVTLSTAIVVLIKWLKRLFNNYKFPKLSIKKISIRKIGDFVFLYLPFILLISYIVMAILADALETKFGLIFFVINVSSTVCYLFFLVILKQLIKIREELKSGIKDAKSKAFTSALIFG